MKQPILPWQLPLGPARLPPATSPHPSAGFLGTLNSTQGGSSAAPHTTRPVCLATGRRRRKMRMRSVFPGPPWALLASADIFTGA